MTNWFSLSLRALLFAVLTFLTGQSALAQPDAAFVIDGNDPRQVMDGFGVQIFVMGYFVDFKGLTYPEFVPELKDRFKFRYVRVIVNPEDGEFVNDNANPNVYDWMALSNGFAGMRDRFGVSVFERLKFLKDAGLEPIPTPNFWPPWMLTPNSDPGNRARFIDGNLPGIYEEIAEYWTAFAIYARDIHGLTFDYFSMQNEPEFEIHTEFTPEQLRLATTAAGQGLAAAGFDTRFIGPDNSSAQESAAFADATFGFGSYTQYLSRVAYHAYDNGALTNNNPLVVGDLANANLISLSQNASIQNTGLRLWMLEFVPNGIVDYRDTLDFGIAYAKHVHNNLTLANASATFIWNVGGSDTDLFVGKASSAIAYRPYAHCFAQYSAYIPVNSRRLGVQASGSTDVSLSAFADDETVTAVMINEAFAARQVQIHPADLGVLGYLTRIETSAVHQAEVVDAFLPDSGPFTLTLPARSVTTLTGSHSVTAPSAVPEWTRYR